jgi:anti-sigma factor RsiW
MNNEPSNREALMTRWIDGDLSEAEAAAFERELAEDPALRKEVEAARGLGDLLRSELPTSKEPPYPELFNSQIMKQTVSDENESKGASNVVRPPSGVWTKTPWLIAAAAVLMAGLLLINKPESARQRGAVASSETTINYSPRDGVVVRTRFAPEADATVMTLEGLEEVPSSHEIEGELVASYLPVAPGDAPVFSSLEDGQPLFVLLTNVDGVPSVVRFPKDSSSKTNL